MAFNLYGPSKLIQSGSPFIIFPAAAAIAALKRSNIKKQDKFKTRIQSCALHFKETEAVRSWISQNWNKLFSHQHDSPAIIIPLPVLTFYSVSCSAFTKSRTRNRQRSAEKDESLERKTPPLLVRMNYYFVWPSGRGLRARLCLEIRI